MIKKCVDKHLTDYLDFNNLNVVYQSAYRKLRSTEICVHNDIAMVLDCWKSVILLLLDLSAAFDTVDHYMLLLRLSSRFGISGMALKWFRSYSVCKRYVFHFGVPQGSVLGLLLYSLYTSSLSDIASKHELSFHFYADDTQLYITFETSSLNDMELSRCTRN